MCYQIKPHGSCTFLCNSQLYLSKPFTEPSLTNTEKKVTINRDEKNDGTEDGGVLEKTVCLWFSQKERYLFLFSFLSSSSWIVLFSSAAMDYFLFFPPLRFHPLASLSFVNVIICAVTCFQPSIFHHLFIFLPFLLVKGTSHSFVGESHGLRLGVAGFLSSLYKLHCVKHVSVCWRLRSVSREHHHLQIIGMLTITHHTENRSSFQSLYPAHENHTQDTRHTFK